MKTFLSSQTINTMQQVNGLHSTCRMWWLSTFRNTQSESKILNIYIFLNTYLLIVSTINPCGSHKRGTRRPTWALEWLTVSVTCSLRMHAHPPMPAPTFSSPSTCESQYCGEPPWPRGSVLGLRPVSEGQCHLNHLTIFRRFFWPSLAYMCTKMA